MTNFDPQSPIPRTLPIGIFDSGVGGLTVAAALRRRLPNERLLYLGDTARLPYGTKSPSTVIRYAEQAADYLVAQGVKMLVVACNTASAHALGILAARYPGLAVLGVVEAGAEAAAHSSATGRIVVIATEGTCRSEAFERAILGFRPDAVVTSLACPLFVALAEEGLTDGPIAEAMAHHYLDPHVANTPRSDALVLGCTHFPLLAPVLARIVGQGTVLVDCAEAVAARADAALSAAGFDAAVDAEGRLDLLTTDAPDQFLLMARRLFPDMEGAAVQLVDIASSRTYPLLWPA